MAVFIFPDFITDFNGTYDPAGQEQDKPSLSLPVFRPTPISSSVSTDTSARPEGLLQPSAGGIKHEKRFIEQTKDPYPGTIADTVPVKSLDRVVRIGLR
jgi:hypothetical protein